MIPITYLRSSSDGAWSMCQQSFFLGYTIGIKSDSFKASRGNLVHKSLELLARSKVAHQNSELVFGDEEVGRKWPTAGFTPDLAYQAAVDHYVPTSPFKDKYTKTELERYRGWLQDTLEFHDGQYNPLNRDVIWPEKHFNISFPQDWANYKYGLPNEKTLEGQLAIMGTMDLVCRVDGHPNLVEIVDWKTGMRLDWATGEVKTIKKLRNDRQLRLYHYAVSKLMPEIEQIVITIVYCQQHDNPKKGMRGGPYTLPPFTKDDLPQTEAMIRERFEEIKNCSRPKLNKSWRCKSFCHFGRNEHPGSNQTLCDFYHGQVMSLGMDRVLKAHANLDNINKYGSGGGIANRDTKDN